MHLLTSTYTKADNHYKHHTNILHKIKGLQKTLHNVLEMESLSPFLGEKYTKESSDISFGPLHRTPSNYPHITH